MPTEVPFTDFSGGLVTAANQTRLSDNQFAALRNLLPDPEGTRLTLRGGERLVLPASLGTARVTGFTRVVIAGVTYLVYALSTGDVWARNEGAGTEAVIHTGANGAARVEFAKFSAFGIDRVFFADGTGELRQWNGVGVATLVGIVPPITTPITTPVTSYVLDAPGQRAWERNDAANPNANQITTEPTAANVGAGQYYDNPSGTVGYDTTTDPGVNYCIVAPLNAFIETRTPIVCAVGTDAKPATVFDVRFYGRTKNVGGAITSRFLVTVTAYSDAAGTVPIGSKAKHIGLMQNKLGTWGATFDLSDAIPQTTGTVYVRVRWSCANAFISGDDPMFAQPRLSVAGYGFDVPLAAGGVPRPLDLTVSTGTVYWQGVGGECTGGAENTVVALPQERKFRTAGRRFWTPLSPTANYGSVTGAVARLTLLFDPGATSKVPVRLFLENAAGVRAYSPRLAALSFGVEQELAFDFSEVPLAVRGAATRFGVEFMGDVPTPGTATYDAGGAGFVGVPLLRLAPVVRPGAVTTLNGISPVSYYVTFASVDNVESNPSPKTIAIERGGLDFDVSLSGLPISTDTRVDRRHIYRVGGNLSRPTRIGTVLDNTTTAFTDTVKDANAGTIQLSFRRDRPPVGLELLTVNKARLIAAKGTTVYVSSLARPDYFPVASDTPAMDGLQFVIPDPQDPIIALGSTGSATLIATRKRVYLLQGNDADSMTINRVADIGCVARRSLVVCRNVAVWLAPDGMVWSLGAGDPKALGRAIERTLDAVPDPWLSMACAAYHRDRYVLCMPGLSGTDTPAVLALDFRAGSWIDLSERYMAGTQYYADTGTGDLDELLLATAPNYLRTTGAVYSGIVATLTTDVLDTPVALKSAALRPFGGDTRTRIDYVRVRGKNVPQTGQSVTITLRAGSNTRTYTLTAATAESSVLLERRVDAALTGRDVSWEIGGAARTLEIEEVTLGVTRKDSLRN